VRAAARLVDLGYRNVIEYPGGLSEWKAIVGSIEGERHESPVEGSAPMR
jgi:rhodanese-related sulfurtransferase